MSTCQKVIRQTQDAIEGLRKGFRSRGSRKTSFLCCKRIPCLCSGLFCFVFFGSLVWISSFLLGYCPASAVIATQQSIDNLFLGSNYSSFADADFINFVDENSIRAIALPQSPVIQSLASAVLTVEGPLADSEKEIVEYIIQPNETLSQIAEKFGITVNTLVWANEILNSSKINPGQKIIILPVSGVLHHVKSGETLSQITKLYGADLEKVISFNDLSEDQKIFVGDLLIIPDGKMPKQIKAFTPDLSIPIPDTLFMCPVSSPCRITQGLHWYNAVDFSNHICGEPVFAVAAGTIQKTGYDRVAGNYVRIIHPSGVITFYGHLSRILVKQDAAVSQGQIIGYTGYTGYTIPAGPNGCHLHFEVRGARNPFGG